jgi:formylglycine-generating enzyme required for sulfatase activity
MQRPDGSAWIKENSPEEADKVLRGGFWNSPPHQCCAGYRYNSARELRYGSKASCYSIGFRVVCEVRSD